MFSRVVDKSISQSAVLAVVAVTLAAFPFRIAGPARSRSSTSRRCSHDLLLVQVDNLPRGHSFPAAVGSSGQNRDRLPKANLFHLPRRPANPSRISFALSVAGVLNLKLGFGVNHVFARHCGATKFSASDRKLSLGQSIRRRKKPRAR